MTPMTAVDAAVGLERTIGTFYSIHPSRCSAAIRVWGAELA
jgi:hypothetical protein